MARPREWLRNAAVLWLSWLLYACGTKSSLPAEDLVPVVDPPSVVDNEPIVVSGPGLAIGYPGAEYGGESFRGFEGGTVDLAVTRLPIPLEGLEIYRKAGVRLVEIPLALDCAAVVVHSSNDWVDRLNIAQLRRIYRAKDKLTWRQLDDRWPDRAIYPYLPLGDQPSGIKHVSLLLADIFTVMGSNVFMLPSDPAAVETVAKGPDKITVCAAKFVTDDVRAVPVVWGEDDQPERVAKGVYAPLALPVLLYVPVASLERARVRELVETYIDSVPLEGCMPVGKKVAARAREHLRNRWTGTHFWTKDGKPRRGSLATVYTEANRVD